MRQEIRVCGVKRQKISRKTRLASGLVCALPQGAPSAAWAMELGNGGCVVLFGSQAETRV